MSADLKKKYSLLYVENDPVSFAHMAKLFSRMGYMLQVAENGYEGVRIYQETRPDLVVTDVELPVLDGLEMARQIRAQDPAAQIVITTRCSDPRSLLAALEIGVQHYLLKPVDPERLTAALEKCVDNLRRESVLQRMNTIATAMEQGPQAVVIADAEGIIEYANTRYAELIGFGAAEALGQELAVVEAGNRFSDIYRTLSEVILKARQWQGEIAGSNSDGECFWRYLTLTPLLDAEGKVERFVGIAEDITVRKEREEEIRKLNAELEYRMIQRNAALEASKKELDDFCDAVSHDLQGPLSRLQGFGNVLMEECRDGLDEQGKIYVERISKTCRELKLIIDGLLNLSQLTRRPMVYQELELGSVVRSVADDLIGADEERKVDFVIAPGVMVKADAGLMRIVLEHLLRNAWKCTIRNPRARIEFGVARNESRTVYFVRDNGIGLDPKYAGKLFRPFQRIHTEEEFSGAGLGLAAVQRIIQRHGGRIWVEGEVERGATFYFTLN